MINFYLYYNRQDLDLYKDYCNLVTISDSVNVYGSIIFNRFPKFAMKIVRGL